MKHLDLYSGLGGFALACEWAGIETICFVEIDPFCRKVLKKHWPNVPIVEDVNNVKEIKRVVENAINAIDGGAETSRHQAINRHTQSADGVWATSNARCLGQTECEVETAGSEQHHSLLLTAGFPCQPFSNAGRKRGASDDRYLWPQTLAVIESVRPDWVLLENVAGILNMVFPDSEAGVASQASFCQVPNDQIADYDTISGGIDRDLRQAGYETVWLVIPACALGAPHRRDRVWIVAYSKGRGIQTRAEQSYETSKVRGLDDFRCDNDYAPDTSSKRQKQPSEIRELAGTRPSFIDEWRENWYEVATRFCRVDARISDRVDRLKALGNAIVPQIACQIIEAIKRTDAES